MSNPKQGIAFGGVACGTCVRNNGEAIGDKEMQKAMERLQMPGNME